MPAGVCVVHRRVEDIRVPIEALGVCWVGSNRIRANKSADLRYIVAGSLSGQAGRSISALISQSARHRYSTTLLSNSPKIWNPYHLKCCKLSPELHASRIVGTLILSVKTSQVHSYLVFPGVFLVRFELICYEILRQLVFIRGLI